MRTPRDQVKPLFVCGAPEIGIQPGSAGAGRGQCRYREYDRPARRSNHAPSLVPRGERWNARLEKVQDATFSENARTPRQWIPFSLNRSNFRNTKMSPPRTLLPFEDAIRRAASDTEFFRLSRYISCTRAAIVFSPMVIAGSKDEHHALRRHRGHSPGMNAPGAIENSIQAGRAVLIDIVETNELALLIGTAFVAGTVRGFSGFGSGLVFLPIAAQVLSPFQALTTVVIADLIGAVPNVPRALRDCDKGDVMRLLAGLAVALPLGIWTLTLLEADTFRYGVSALALVLLLCLLSGLRYRGPVPDAMVFATGGLSGFSCGVAGIPGPPVILFYMARPLSPPVIRANTFIFLSSTDIAMLPALFAFGRLDGSAVLLGGLLIAPNMAGNMFGAWLFRPEHERVYRSVAYLIIATTAISSLPVWD